MSIVSFVFQSREKKLADVTLLKVFRKREILNVSTLIRTAMVIFLDCFNLVSGIIFQIDTFKLP